MLLNIQRVRFKNFYSFGAKWQEISLSEGINLVVGYDKDSGRRNGAGKSCLVDSIVFGLFGKTSKDVNLAGIVNWKNKKACEVHIDFEVNDVNYRIERGLKPNFLRLYKEGKEVEQVAQKKDFQSEIEQQILGIDFDTFMALIYCNPNTQVSIFSTGKAQKRALLETLFNLDEFSKISKTANEKISLMNQKIQEAETELEHNRRMIASLEEQNESLERRKIHVDDEAVSIAYSDYSYAEQKLKEAGEFNFSMEELTRIKTKLSTAIRNIYKRISEESTSPGPNTVKALMEMRSKAQTRLKRASEEKGILDERMVSLKSELAIALGERKMLPDISKLQDGCNCPTCLSMVSLEKVTAELSKLEASIKLREDAIRERIADVHLKLGQIDEVKNSIQEEVVYIDDSVQNQKNFIRTRAIVRLQSYLENLEETETNAKNKQTLVEKVKRLEQEWIRLQDKKESAQRENGAIIAQQAENIQKIESMQQANQEFEKSRSKFLGMRDYADYIKTLCKDENVKQYAISHIIPFINQKANEYLSQTGFNFYLKIDSFLDVEIKGPGITGASYGNMSGGEGKTINLAVQLALMDVCKMKSPVFPNILLLDELLDSAVDGPGLAAMVEIIKYKQLTNNLKVYIISHRKEINEFESTKIYQVTKVKGYSTVEEIS